MENQNEILNLAKNIARVLDNKKAHNVQILKVTDKTIIADYFVIANGTSSTQVKSLADEVVLADIYAARETDTLGVSAGDIADRIVKMGRRAQYIPSFDEIETFILENCQPGDLLITMGAGDIVRVGEKLLGQ